MYIGMKNLYKQMYSNIFGLKKVTMTALAFTTISLGTGTVVSADANLTTVYYVYNQDDYIGTVSNKEVIESALHKKVSEAEENYDQVSLTIGSELTYIPEQVFGSGAKTDDQKVIQELTESLAVEAEAYALKIGDDSASVYVKDYEAAKEVIEALKLKYVTKEQLQLIEQQEENSTRRPLKENETRILDVSLSKEIEIEEKIVSVKELMSIEDAVQYLLKGTLHEKTYKVQEGDVLGKIANDHDMTLEQLLSINPKLKDESTIKVGQQLNVTFLKPLVEVMVEKETFKKEAIAHEKEVVEDSTMYKGDIEVIQEGKDGFKEILYKSYEQNGILVKLEAIDEKIVEEPVKHIVKKGTKVIPSRGDGTFAWPAVGGYISSPQGARWGKLHKGIDIARPSDRSIKAADNGKVVSAGWDGGYGNKIVIDHQNGYKTIYAHLSSISVSVGQTVTKGTKIGVMGSTGNSTGIHLHFEIYKNGSLKDPQDYL